MDWNPLRSFVTQALKSTLEKYIVNVDFEALGVTGGAMVLRDLELRKEAFPAKNGIRLDRGFVKELRVSIPWTQLLSAPVQVEIRTCEIVIVHDDDVGVAEVTSSRDGSSGVLHATESARMLKRRSDASVVDEERGWLADTLRAITANATIEVSNLVFKFERNDVVATVSLKSLSAFTCDSQNWEKKFQKPADPFGAIFKTVEIGGLTINVEALAVPFQIPPSPSKDETQILFSPRRTVTTFEVPVLKRTDARIRMCLHLTPGVAERPQEAKDGGGENTGKQSSSSINSLPNLLQRVSSVVSVGSHHQQLSAGVVSRSKTEEFPKMESSKSRDPYLFVIDDPYRYPNHQLIAAVDIWIDRLDFSISEKQMIMLQTLFAPPPSQIVEHPHAPSSPALMDRHRLDPVNAKSAVEPEIEALAQDSVETSLATGWTSWAWKVVGGDKPELDEADMALKGLLPSLPVQTTTDASRAKRKNLTVSGLRIDRISLALVLHPKSRYDGPSSANGGKADDRSSQTSIRDQSSSAKKVIPVKTPKGIVYVDADEDEAEEERKRKSQRAAHRLITFAEFTVRGLVIQVTRAVHLVSGESTSSVLIDVQGLEASRWHDVYVDRSYDVKEEVMNVRDTFLSWVERSVNDDASRATSEHPHQAWSLWAHPPVSQQSPAIRIRVDVNVVPRDEIDEQKITVDVAMAPLSLFLDSLLFEGMSRFLPSTMFLPSSQNRRIQGQTKNSQKTLQPTPPISISALLTWRAFEFKLVSGSESVAIEMSDLCVLRKDLTLDVNMKLLECMVRPGLQNKMVFALNELALSSFNPRTGQGVIEFHRIIGGFSPGIVRAAIDVALGVADPILNILPNAEVKQLLTSLISAPETPSEFALDQTTVEINLLNFFLERAATLVDGKPSVVLRLSAVTINAISGHTHTIFRSRSASTFIDVVFAEREALEIKLAGWELDFDGIVRAVDWASRFVPQNISLKSSTDGGRSIQDVPTSPLSPLLAIPSVSLDIEPGDMLFASSKPNSTSELRTPLITVRSRARGERVLFWTIQGMRMVIDGVPVLPHAKANGAIYILERAGKSGVGIRLEANIGAILIDLSLDQARTIAEQNVNKLIRSLNCMPFSARQSAMDSGRGRQPASSSIETEVDLILEAVHINLLMGSAAMAFPFEAVPSRDIPEAMLFRLEDFKLSLNQTSPTVFELYCTLKNARVTEESSRGLHYPLLCFLPSGDVALKVDVKRRETVQNVQVFSAALDICGRSPAWRSILAYAQLFELPDRSRAVSSSHVVQPNGSSSISMLKLRLDIGAGSTLSVPITSTLKSDNVETISLRLRKGLFWDDEAVGAADRTLGGSLELCYGVFVRPIEQSQAPSFVIRDVFTAIEPQIEFDVNDSGLRAFKVEMPIVVTLVDAEHVTRLRRAGVVLSSLSLLEFPRTSRFKVASAVEAERKHSPPLPKVDFSLPQVSLSLFSKPTDKQELLAIRLIDLAVLISPSQTQGVLDGVNLGFRSFTITAAPSRCQNIYTIFRSHEFSFARGLVELSRGEVDIHVDASVVESLCEVCILPETFPKCQNLPLTLSPAKRAPKISMQPIMPSLGNLKLLIPQATVVVAAKHVGPAVVIRLAEGFASITNECTFDATFVNLEVLMPVRMGSFESAKSFKHSLTWPRALPKTNVRVFGELSEERRSLAVDCAKVDIYFGLDTIAVLAAVTEQFSRAILPASSLLKAARTNQASPAVEQHLDREEEVELMEIQLSAGFHTLLDRRLDPSENQMVFSDQPTVDEALLGERHGRHGMEGDSVYRRFNAPRNEAKARWVGFRFRLHEAHTVISCSIAQVIALEPAFMQFVLESGMLDVELLAWDSVRARWTLLTQACPRMTVAGAKPLERSFSDAFSSWIAEELESGHIGRVGSEVELSRDIMHVQDKVVFASDLYWVRWRLPRSWAASSLIDAQRLALSNSIMQSMSLFCSHRPNPLIDLSLNGTELALHLLHSCEASAMPSELSLLRFPSSSVRCIIHNENHVSTTINLVVSAQVSRVANFTRATILRDTPLFVDVDIRKPSLGSNSATELEIEIRTGKALLDVKSDILTVASHALRGLILDASPARIKKRVKRLLEGDPEAEQTQDNSACLCTRTVLVNATGTKIVFGRVDDEREFVTLDENVARAYSWSPCLCQSGNETPQSHLARFALLDDNEQPGPWSAPINLERLGVSRLRVVAPSSSRSRASGHLVGPSDSCDLIIGIQFGEPSTQTIVVIHSGVAISNRSKSDLELCALGADDSTFAITSVPSLRSLSATQKCLHPSLAQDVSSRVMVGSKRQGGWMMRVKGASTWSRIVSPTLQSEDATLVEVPAPLSNSDGGQGRIWIWIRSRVTMDGDDLSANRKPLWTQLDIFPSLTVENKTDIPLSLRIRPEHRWESLQYALQSVATGTSPPGPVGERSGTWLALPPNAQTNLNGTVQLSKASPPPRRALKNTYSSSSSLVLADEDDSMTLHSGRAQTPQSNQRGQQLAMDLLRSVSPPPSSLASPRQGVFAGSPLGESKHKSFSSYLEQSSLLADDATVNIIVRPGESFAFEQDPNECHAIILGRAGESIASESPLRIHPAMFRSGRSWSRRVQVSSGLHVVAEANSSADYESDNGPQVSVVISPLYRLRNDTDRVLFYVPVDEKEDSWLDGARPTRIDPGDEHSLYWGSEGEDDVPVSGLALACPALATSDVNPFTLDWSATVPLGSYSQNLVLVPLVRSTVEGPDGLFCGWVLQTLVSVNSHGAITLTSRCGAQNGTGLDICLGLSPADYRMETLTVRIPSGSVSSLPTFFTEDATLTCLASVQLLLAGQKELAPPSAFVDMPVGLAVSSDSAVAPPTKSHLLAPPPVSLLVPKCVSIEDRQAGLLLKCEFSHSSTHNSNEDTGPPLVLANFTQDSQSQFIIENSSYLRVLDVVLFDSKIDALKRGRGEWFCFRLPPRSYVPVDWSVASRLRQINGRVVVAATVNGAISLPLMEKFFSQSTTSEECLITRFVPMQEALEDHNQVKALRIASRKDIEGEHSSKELGFSPPLLCRANGGNSAKESTYDKDKSLNIALNYELGVTKVSIGDGSVAPETESIRRTASVSIKFLSESLGLMLSHLPDSVLSDERPLLLAAAKGISAKVLIEETHIQSQPRTRVSTEFHVTDLQVDSLVEGCELPVVLAFERAQTIADDPEMSSHVDETRVVSVKLDLIQTKATKQGPPRFERVEVTVAPLILNFEDESLKEWAHVLAPAAVSIVADWNNPKYVVDADKTKERPKKETLFICDVFSISELSVLLTVKTSTGVFVGIDRTPITLWPVAANQIRCSPVYMRSELGANYLADLLLSSPALLGSLEILGNPTNLIRSIARGIYGLVAIPLSEAKRGFGPGRVVRGVARGWLGLIRNVADGTLTSISGFSASVARNLHLSVQSNENGGRSSRRRETSIDHEEQSHSFSFGTVLRGVAGLIVKPAEGAADLVARSTKGLIVSARLRRPIVRLDVGLFAPIIGVDADARVDVDQMLSWKLFPKETWPGSGLVRSCKAKWERMDPEHLSDSGLSLVDVRVVLTNEGVYGVEPCLLHHTAGKLANPAVFNFAWNKVISVEESLVKANLVVLVVATEHNAEQVRLRMEDSTQRRLLVIETLTGLRDFGNHHPGSVV